MYMSHGLVARMNKQWEAVCLSHYYISLYLEGSDATHSVADRQEKNSGNTDTCLLILRQPRGNAGTTSRGGMNHLDTCKLYIWYHTRGRGGRWGKSAGKWNHHCLLCCTCLFFCTYIHPSTHPSIHPSIQLSQSVARSIFTQMKEGKTERSALNVGNIGVSRNPIYRIGASAFIHSFYDGNGFLLGGKIAP